MKKKFKKVVAAITLCAFSLGITTPLYANDALMMDGVSAEILAKVSNDITDSQKEQLLTDAEVLSTYGLLELGEIKKVSINNENFEYVIDYGTVKETVEIIANSSRELVINVTAGNVKDTLVVNHTTGEVFLDGNKVEIAKSVKPRVSDRYITESCPYGSAADYNKSIGIVEEDNNIYFSDIMENLTLTAFTIVLGALGGTTGGVAVGIAAFLYYVMTTEYPKSNAMSYITYGYHHKDSAITGYISGYGAAVTKMVSFFYAGADYQDYIDSETNYEVWIRY